MKRLRRWIINCVTAASVVLCVACAVLWIRSISTCDSAVYVTRTQNHYSISTGPHVLVLCRDRNLHLLSGGTYWMDEAPDFGAGLGLSLHSVEWQHLIVVRLGIRAVRGLGGNTIEDFSTTPFTLGTANSWNPLAHQFMGFGYDSVQQNFMAEVRVAIPFWVLMLICGILPALQVSFALGRGRRRRLGLCLTCGYDLRASKDRCPECGTAIPSKKK